VLRRLVKITLRIVIYLACLGIVILGLPRLITFLTAQPRLFSTKSVPPTSVAVVFGAGLWGNGRPSSVLRDRVKTATVLYFAGKVEKLLMSGANPSIYYNEPESMKGYALELGVPEQDIVLDYAGRSTYETCYRARDIFGLNDVILVTQRFHLPRALYICNALGIHAVGVPADQRKYRLRALLYWHLREIPATLNAFWQVHFSHPLPFLGKDEPIYSEEVR
jgi:vancomycin permeability regulator SanA